MKRTHHHVILLVVGSLFVVGLVALTSLVLYKNSQALQSQTALLHASEVTSMPVSPTNSVSPTQNSNQTTFSGPITEVDDSCSHDGICRIQVNGVWVIDNLGGDMRQELMAQKGPKGIIILSDGSTTGAIVGKDKVGKTVEVLAKQQPDGTYTIYGSSDYYIKFK